MSCIAPGNIGGIISLPGEKFTKLQLEGILIKGETAKINATNFRILIEINGALLLTIPLNSILRIMQTLTIKSTSVDIIIQTIELYELTLTSKKSQNLFKTLQKIIKNKKYQLPSDSTTNQQGVYLEQNRKTVINTINYYNEVVNDIFDERWRLYDISKCSSTITTNYPKYICIPRSINDRMITNCANKVIGGKIPILCWKSNESKACIFRSGYFLSQPPTEEQIEYWNALKQIFYPKEIILIGVEEINNMDTFDSISLFMSTDLQISQLLFNLLQYPIPVPFMVNHFQEILRWERRIHNTFSAVKSVLQMLFSEKSVILLSNLKGGPLFTLSSLVQLIIDPYFRTFHGFCTLIEKEFFYFKYPFNEKSNPEYLQKSSSSSNQINKKLTPQNTNTNLSSNSAIPPSNVLPSNENVIFEFNGIFILFLDCVWTLLSQSPSSFQFRKEFILYLSDIVYSGLFTSQDPSFKGNNNKFDDNVNIWNIKIDKSLNFNNPFFVPIPSKDLFSSLFSSGAIDYTWNSWLLQRKFAFSDSFQVIYSSFFFF